jgi:hypothetical protein
MDKYVTLKFTQSSDVEAFTVHSPGSKIELKPNAKSISRLAFNYKFITISLSFTLKFLPGNDNDTIRGKSKSNGFGFGFNFSNWSQHLSWQKTKGYYLNNTNEYVPNWKDGQPYIQFPDLSILNFEGVTAYKANENYSVNALATQSERQLKSAGTFVVPLNYRYYMGKDKTPRNLPSDIRQKSSNLELTLSAGYYYTFVLKKTFYIGIGATPGGGVLFSKITSESETEKQVSHQTNGIFRIDGLIGMGYNAERFFAGFYSQGFVTSYKQQRSVVVTDESRLAFQFFVGYRLNAPKFLKKEVEKAEKLMKIL